MAYPLINGAAINDEDGGAILANSLRPVRFGVPALRMQVASLQPVRFGPAVVKHGTDIVVKVYSLAPLKFGAHTVMVGMPPGGTAVQVSSLRAGTFGTPAAALHFVAGAAGALQPVSCGQHGLQQSFGADSLRPVTFGQQSAGAAAGAKPLCPVSFGAPGLHMELPATPLVCWKFGTPSRSTPVLMLPASSLAPLQFGKPSFGGVALRARTFCPAHFGRHVLDRGSAC